MPHHDLADGLPRSPRPALLTQLRRLPKAHVCIALCFATRHVEAQLPSLPGQPYLREKSQHSSADCGTMGISWANSDLQL